MKNTQTQGKQTEQNTQTLTDIHRYSILTYTVYDAHLQHSHIWYVTFHIWIISSTARVDIPIYAQSKHSVNNSASIQNMPLTLTAVATHHYTFLQRQNQKWICCSPILQQKISMVYSTANNQTWPGGYSFKCTDRPCYRQNITIISMNQFPKLISQVQKTSHNSSQKSEGQKTNVSFW